MQCVRVTKADQCSCVFARHVLAPNPQSRFVVLATDVHRVVVVDLQDQVPAIRIVSMQAYGPNIAADMISALWYGIGAKESVST